MILSFSEEGQQYEPVVTVAEQIANDSAVRAIQVEIQDDNTSLIQDIDPAKEHLKVTTRNGNTYQVLTFDQDHGHVQEDPNAIQEKKTTECTLTATLKCGEDHVSSVSYEKHLLWSSCEFECDNRLSGLK